MKLSETKAEWRQGRLDYVENRWKQLYEKYQDTSQGIVSYLFTVNGAGAAATLGFLGASKVAPPIELRIALAWFFVGLLCVGVGRAIAVYWYWRVFSGWRKDVSEYFGDKIRWDELLDADLKRSGYNWWLDLFGWISFFSFVAGGVYGCRALFY